MPRSPKTPVRKGPWRKNGGEDPRSVLEGRSGCVGSPRTSVRKRGRQTESAMELTWEAHKADEPKARIT